MKNSNLSNWLFRKQHWLLVLCIVLPIGFLATLELTHHFYLAEAMPRTQERLSIILILVVGVLVFSNLVFAIIRGLQKASDKQKRQLRALNEIGLKLASEHQLDDVITTVLKSACLTAKANVGVLVMINEDGSLRSFMECTEGDCRLQDYKTQLTNGILKSIIKDGRSLIVNNIKKQAQIGFFINSHPVVRHLIGVPIIRLSKVIGGIYLCDRKDGRKFNQEDLSILSLLSSQAAVAVENSRIYERLARLSILEDRQKIAMDLHDGAIQSLYALGLQLESLTGDDNHSKLGHIRVTGAREKIILAIGNINLVIKDLRNYIYCLNQNDNRNLSIVSAIHQESVRLKAHGIRDIDINISTDLSPEQDSLLYIIERALHECVSNVIRHSEATRVELKLTCLPGLSVIQVNDNGVGTDLELAENDSCLGINNIRSRLAQINGIIELESAKGEGFSISMKIPESLKITYLSRV